MAMNMDASLRLSAKVDGLNNIVSLNRGLQSVESTARGVTGAMRGLTGAAAGLSGALGTLAPLLSVAGLAGMVQNTIKAGDSMYDLSQKTGIAVESLAKFKKAAAVSGTDIEGVSKSLVKLSKTMLDAQTGGKASIASFKALGISVTGANGQMKSADSVMLEIANRFKAMPDGVAKTALALRLFGRAGAEMIPMLNMGGDAIDKLSVKMTTAFAEKMDKYSDRLAMLSGKVGALGMDLTIALLPVLETLTDVVSKLITTFNDLPQPIKDVAIAGASIAIAWGPTVALLRGAIAVFTSLTTAQVAAGAAAAASAPQYAAASASMSAGAIAAARLAAVLSKLAALGIVTVGVEFLINGARQGQRIEDIAQRLQKGGTGASFDPSVSSRSQVENARKAALQTIQSARQELKNQKPLGWVSVIPGLSVALAGMQGARNTELQGRISDAQTVLKLNPRQFQSNPGGPGGGFTPDLSALESGGGSKSKNKDDSKRIQEAIRASAEALKKSKAELAILKETDPLKKIMLDYAEKERAINAQAKKDTADARSQQEKLNIENKRTTDLDKLKIERTNELTQKYKELKGAGFEVAGSLEQWQLGAEKSNTAMAGLRDGITSYIERIGSLREQVSQLSGQLLQTVEGSLSTAISSAVSNFASGAESIQQTLSDLFKSIGDAFIKMASEIIAQQLMMAAFNAILGITGGGSLINKASGLNKTVGFGAGTFTGFATGGVMSSNGVVPLKRYADGGVANSPQVAMFGERGPEAYVPLPDGRTIPVKISGAMDRYRPGAVGAASAGDTEQAMGSDGNGPVDGAIDVRYTVERINNVEYVTAEQFQIGMRQAANQGASQGERRALKTLQASRSVRNRVGLR